jgi:ribonucleoside-diphosphate reductase alpha chain
MAIMKIDHPDILEFMTAKLVDGKFSNFNFSVSLTDAFMEAATERPNELWMCQWNGVPMKPRMVKRDPAGRAESITEVDLTAGQLLDQIVDYAWTNGEPGCIFIDTVNKSNPLPGLGPIECCNPCGEQFLHDGDACNLGSINLENFVTPDGKIDFVNLRRVTKIATRFLDDVIDQTDFQVERVRKTFTNNRRIGLGIMGLADLLFKLKLRYNSPEGREAASQVMRCIQESAIEASEENGIEKGSFPNFDKSKWATNKKAMRNASLTNVAPCGSTALLYDVSSGIEPYFALAYKRQNKLAGGEMEIFVNKHLKKALEDCNCYTPEIMEKVIQTGTLQRVLEVPKEVRDVFVTSMDISAHDHCLMQAAVQKYCCNAISKTINFAHNATRDDIKQVFVDGWRLGIKGMTVYRSGSRDSQVLVTIEEQAQKAQTGCPEGKCDL